MKRKTEKMSFGHVYVFITTTFFGVCAICLFQVCWIYGPPWKRKRIRVWDCRDPLFPQSTAHFHDSPVVVVLFALTPVVRCRRLNQQQPEDIPIVEPSIFPLNATFFFSFFLLLPSIVSFLYYTSFFSLSVINYTIFFFFAFSISLLITTIEFHVDYNLLLRRFFFSLSAANSLEQTHTHRHSCFIYLSLFVSTIICNFFDIFSCGDLDLK